MSVSQQPICAYMKGLPPEALQEVAAYFQTLSEPTRLQILNYLREGERNVGRAGAALRLHGGERVPAPGHADQARDGRPGKPRHERLLPHRRRPDLCAMRSGMRQHCPPVRANRARPEGVRPDGRTRRRQEVKNVDRVWPTAPRMYGITPKTVISVRCSADERCYKPRWSDRGEDLFLLSVLSAARFAIRKGKSSRLRRVMQRTARQQDQRRSRWGVRGMGGPSVSHR